MLTYEDVVIGIDDFKLSPISECICASLIASGKLKNYKWKKKIRDQEKAVFKAFKNALIDCDARIVYAKGQEPAPTMLVIPEEVINNLLSNSP